MQQKKIMITIHSWQWIIIANTTKNDYCSQKSQSSLFFDFLLYFQLNDIRFEIECFMSSFIFLEIMLYNKLLLQIQCCKIYKSHFFSIECLASCTKCLYDKILPKLSTLHSIWFVCLCVCCLAIIPTHSQNCLKINSIKETSDWKNCIPIVVVM